MASEQDEDFVTITDVNKEILYETYFTGHEGYLGAFAEQPPKKIRDSLKCLVFCVLVLKNGFTVTGTSACVAPTNFDVVVQRSSAKRRAMKKVMELLAYQLKTRLKESNDGK